MIRVLAAFILGGLALGCTLVASAQPAPVPVRAVEHPEYSRLVLALPSGVKYSMSKNGASAVLRLSGDVPDYDVSGIFDRMPRTRILAARFTGRGNGRNLTLSLACACSVELERIGSGFLAIDVRRDENGDGAESPRRLLVPGPASGGETGASTSGATGTGPGGDAPSWGTPPAGPNKSQDPVNPATDPVAAAQRALLGQLALAAEAGLLTLAPQAHTDSPVLSEADAAAATLSRSPTGNPPLPVRNRILPPPQPSPAPAGGLLPHVSVHTGLEPSPASPAGDSGSVQACIQDATLDMAGWALNSPDYGTEIGTRRRALVGAGGKTDAAAVDALARIYIGAGFGREAAALLRVLGTETRDSLLLNDLAMLVEGRPLDPDGPISAATDCLGRVTLWQAAGGVVAFEPETDAGAAIRDSMLELPPLLRRLVGQEVARHALLAGRHDAASEIIDILDRTPGAQSAAELRVRAEVHLAEGNPDLALAATRSLVEGIATPDFRSLELHARAMIAGGATVPDDLVTAIDAGLPTIPADSAPGRRLRIIRAQLASQAGEHLPALAALRALPGSGARAMAEVRIAGQAILAALPPDLRRSQTGARAILENRFLLGDDAKSRVLRLGYAQALLAGGLPNASLELLQSQPGMPDHETGMLIARANLQLGNAARALAALDALSGEDAARLRAEAHIREGNPDAAFVALRTVTAAASERNTMALLSGRWQEIDASTLHIGGLATYAIKHGQNDAAKIAAPRRSIDVAELALTAARGLRTALADFPAPLTGATFR